jgi:membrane protein YdbS with pleckstrin-like domain
MNAEIIVLHPHPAAHIPNYLAGVAIMLFTPWLSYLAFATGLLVIAVTEALRRAERYVVMDNGVMREFKFLAVSRTFVEYGQIANIHVDQNIIDRVFGIGTVAMDTSGSNNVELHFRHIKNPHEVELMIRGRVTDPVVGR